MWRSIRTGTVGFSGQKSENYTPPSVERKNQRGGWLCGPRFILARMSNSVETTERSRRGPEPPDLSERGGMKNGQPQRSDVRLFMQLLAFGECRDARALGAALDATRISGALYEDMNDPR